MCLTAFAVFFVGALLVYPERRRAAPARCNASRRLRAVIPPALHAFSLSSRTGCLCRVRDLLSPGAPSRAPSAKGGVLPLSWWQRLQPVCLRLCSAESRPLRICGFSLVCSAAVRLARRRALIPDRLHNPFLCHSYPALPPHSLSFRTGPIRAVRGICFRSYVSSRLFTLRNEGP